MKKESNLKIFIKVLIVFLIVCYFLMHCHTCAELGCRKSIPFDQKYCNEHPSAKRIYHNYNTHRSNSNKSNSSSSYHSSSGSSSSSSSYDEAYDDYYYDGDYDTDRYEEDQDYADGIDDAMDEYGDDW